MTAVEVEQLVGVIVAGVIVATAGAAVGAAWAIRTFTTALAAHAELLRGSATLNGEAD